MRDGKSSEELESVEEGVREAAVRMVRPGERFEKGENVSAIRAGLEVHVGDAVVKSREEVVVRLSQGRGRVLEPLESMAPLTCDARDTEVLEVVPKG